MAPTWTVLQYSLGILLMNSNCFVCLCLFNKQSCCHLSEYTLKLFNFGFFGARVDICPAFRQVWILGFLWSTLWHFWSVFFCLSFLKRNSTFCKIYWTPNLQSLKLVCFVVANTWMQKYADSRQTFLDNMAFFIEDNDMWKHFTYWLSSSKSSLKHWTADEF